MIQQPLPRRRFLKLFATAGAVATGAGLSLQISGCSDSEQLLKTYTAQFGTLLAFNETQAITLFALSQTFVNNPDAPSQIITLVKRLDEEMYFVQQSIRDDFKLALDFLEYLPMAYGEFSRLSRMSLEQRTIFISSIQNSSIDAVRVAVSGCRMLVFVCYYSQDASWQSIGFDGPHSKIPEKLSPQRLHYRQLTQPLPQQGTVSTHTKQVMK